MEQAGNAFAGVAFHCYAGSVSDQNEFHTLYPQKEIYFTECSGTIGSDWWSDIKVRLLFIGSMTKVHIDKQLNSGTWIICELSSPERLTPIFTCNTLQLYWCHHL